MTVALESRLSKRHKQGNLRKLTVRHDLIDFSSNDYLGLARSAELAIAARRELEKSSGILSGLGSTGSRLLTGNCHYVEELEGSIAHFHGYEAGLIFNCGYMANVGLLSAIACAEDVILFDSHVHASTHDGIRLSKAKAFPFKHNSPEHLESRLKTLARTKVKECFICIESIYSTDGSVAPLTDIAKLAEKYAAKLIVDEAHAVGVLGPKGRGLVAHHNLIDRTYAQIVTFGKAIGTQGAIVLGSRLLKNGLTNFSHSFVYTTALPLQALAAIKCSYDIFPGMEKERRHLQEILDKSFKTVKHSSSTHIQAVFIPGNDNARFAVEKLAHNGFDVRALLSPTVQRGKEMLRICLHSYNTQDQVEMLLEVIISLNFSSASRGV